MTEVHEVHLFTWIKENGAFLGPIALLVIGMMAGWTKVMMSRYPLRDEMNDVLAKKLKECAEANDKRYVIIEADAVKVTSLIIAMDQKLDKIDDRRRDDAIKNNEAHEHILSLMLKKHDS